MSDSKAFVGLTGLTTADQIQAELHQMSRHQGDWPIAGPDGIERVYVVRIGDDWLVDRIGETGMENLYGGPNAYTAAVRIAEEFDVSTPYRYVFP